MQITERQAEHIAAIYLITGTKEWSIQNNNIGSSVYGSGRQTYGRFMVGNLIDRHLHHRESNLNIQYADTNRRRYYGQEQQTRCTVANNEDT